LPLPHIAHAGLILVMHLRWGQNFRPKRYIVFAEAFGTEQQKLMALKLGMGLTAEFSFL
jgi:hypothetical protein